MRGVGTHPSSDVVVRFCAVRMNVETGHPSTGHRSVKEHHMIPHLQSKVLYANYIILSRDFLTGTLEVLHFPS